jgi:hypothetical protein
LSEIAPFSAGPMTSKGPQRGLKEKEEAKLLLAHMAMQPISPTLLYFLDRPRGISIDSSKSFLPCNHDDYSITMFSYNNNLTRCDNESIPASSVQNKKVLLCNKIDMKLCFFVCTGVVAF